MVKLLAATTLSSFLLALFGVSWDIVDKKIAREFPAVEYVSTDILMNRFSESNSSLPLLIDVRKFEEYKVSHLSDALNLETAASISSLVESQGLAKDTEIIVYCSVGYRSAAVAAELQELGYSNVLNLRHSIFEWANKGYPLHTTTGTTDKVHPFNKAWGVLVDEDRHAFPVE
jgi:rhodanese-related sulfurtransferase